MCTCGAESPNGCTVGSFCWEDGTCNPHAKCTVTDDHPVTDNNCQCSFPSSELCKVDQYCVEENSVNVCVNNRSFFQ